MIYQLIICAIKCKNNSHHNVQDYHLFTIINDDEKQPIIKFKKLKNANV